MTSIYYLILPEKENAKGKNLKKALGNSVALDMNALKNGKYKLYVTDGRSISSNKLFIFKFSVDHPNPIRNIAIQVVNGQPVLHVTYMNDKEENISLDALKGLKGDPGLQGPKGDKGDPGLKATRGIRAYKDLRATREIRAYKGLKATRGIRAYKDLRATREIPAYKDLRVIREIWEYRSLIQVYRCQARLQTLKERTNYQFLINQRKKI